MFYQIKEETRIALGSGLGMWAFLLHRLTGLALVFYLLLHIMVISTSLQGSAAFNKLLAVLTTPLFIALDMGLLAAVLFHGLNGVRIIIFDLGFGIRRQKLIFWLCMLPAALIWIMTFFLTLPHFLEKLHG